MNVNGARFHLLLGHADWGRCLDSDDNGALALDAWWSAEGSPFPTPPATLPSWDKPRHEITLQPLAIELPATGGERPLTLDARRGAAADRYCNVYRIADDGLELLVTSSGSGNEAAFWPAEPADCTQAHEANRPLFETHAPMVATAPEGYLAMAVTSDDYLVVAFRRGTQRGLLSFDLIAGGSPHETLWPTPGFEPFDMCARVGGGVWILDRINLRLWELDCKLAVVSTGQTELTIAPAQQDDFQPLSGPARERPAVVFPGGLPLDGSPPWVFDPIAIDTTTEGAVLLLDLDAGGNRSRVVRLRRDSDVWAVDASAWLDKTQAHDFVYASAPRFQLDKAATPRLFITTTIGNQAQGFDVVDRATGFELRKAPELYPLRRYAGRALLAVCGSASYDSGLDRVRWTPIVQQPRVRFQPEANFVTTVFDSNELGTTWDKLLLDACIPADTEVRIESRAGDEREDMVAAADSPGGAQVIASWSPEPVPRLRTDGCELPWVRSEAVRATRREGGTGTWELLLQKARGRYLQLRIRLRSNNGTATPRLRALRIWSPRFSYSERFLPAAYREEPTQANFLERWLANFESTLTNIEDRVAQVQSLFDPRIVPAEALAWLAEWFDVALDPAWDQRRHRLFVKHAMDFFRWRGTTHGLRLALELAFDPCFDEAMFAGPRPRDDGARRIRIVEAYQTRLIGAVAAGDPSSAVSDGPLAVMAQPLWTPPEGNSGLADRYATSQGRTATPVEQITPFQLVAPSGDTGWDDFCMATLGFVPSAGADERSSWQTFLRSRYVTVEALNAQHGATYASIAAVTLPPDLPANANAATDWDDFCAYTSLTRTRWQGFLAGRYRRIERLQGAHRTHWLRFDQVPLTDVLPATAAAQTDWLQFEGQLLAMHRTAHRFSVLLPMDSVTGDPYAREQKLALARRMVDLEKPAHTVFDVRFFWAFNRVGEARLGLDTQLGAGSRAPELIPDAVVGRAYIGASFVGGAARPRAGDRLLIDC